MVKISREEEALRLLLELHAVLKKNDETNWRQGIDAAIGELLHEGGAVNKAGFENARSIYKTMNEGGRGFAEYFVWSDDEDARIAANKKLDELRTKAWESFDL